MKKNTIKLSHVSGYIAIWMMFIVCYPSQSYAQRNYLFENISIPEGLSNSEVHDIFQDSNGFLWISTADGLNRYDGNNIKVFRNDPSDTTTISNNNCFAITEDSSGFIWVGVSGNIIAKYNPLNETFKSYPIETLNFTDLSEFYSALCDSKGNLWFGTTKHEMQKFNWSKDRFEQVLLDSSNTTVHWGEIYGITELSNGNILASDYGSGLKIYNEKLNVFQPYFLKSNYSPDEINFVYETESGNIWFAGRNKLIKYYPSSYTTEEFDVFSLIKNPTSFDNVTGLTEDIDGYVWIGIYSQGIYRIDQKTKVIKKYNFGFDDSDVSARIIMQKILRDKYGVLWIATWGKGVIKFDPLREPFSYSKINSKIVGDASTGIISEISWSQIPNEFTVGTTTNGLYYFNYINNDSKNIRINFKPSTIPNGVINIQGLATDNKGNKWFTYNNLGLHKLDNKNNLISISSSLENKTTSYTSTQVKIDKDENIWVASIQGFEIYSPSKNKLAFLPSLMNKKMSDQLKHEIYKITESRKPLSAILEVGEASNLVKKFSLKNDQKVMVVCVGEGRLTQGIDGLWDTGSLLTDDGKLIWSMNNLSETFNDDGGFKNRIAVKCLELKKGNYKISFTTDVGHSYGNWNVEPPADSTWYGIQILSLNEKEYEAIKSLSQQEINLDNYVPFEAGTFIEFSKKLNNIVWLGSQRNGFFKYDLATKKFKQYNFDSRNKFSPNNSISFIFEDSEGILWVATQNSLVRFEPIKEILNQYTQRDGLPSNQINSIIEDHLGNLWISTSGGLSKLNKNAPTEKWNFVNYDTRDGLPGFSSSKANWINEDGKIFLGANDGLISFYPGKINEVKPDIVIEDIKVSDISLKSDSSVVKVHNSVMKLDELDLSYTQNNISFEFAAIQFSRPEKNKIMYRLDGFDDHWTSTDRNFVSFTNLSPGKYTYRVKGSNGDGIWNEEGKSIKIIINPPWWETTAAYISYFFLFGFLVFGIDRFQRKRLLEKERTLAKEKELAQAKEIEKAYHELKNTQSQLLHAEKMASLGALTAGIAHEIKNPLNFVSNFSEVSRELLDEMKSELQNGNSKEAMEIGEDLKLNLEKIIQHGRRADSIVKGMLLHSRGTSGEKSLTDINDLLDQYVTLAYHGLRAQDKDFNVTIEKDYDNAIEKINVVPQDISRVFLNLINNACYAANDKKKVVGNDFVPLLKVSTKNLKDKIEIHIKDNGNGIPESVRANIFNPFFTTKPTGEGTGLGLSLSYDIVTKIHGGDIKFETKEGEFTEFIITLLKTK